MRACSRSGGGVVVLVVAEGSKLVDPPLRRLVEQLVVVGHHEIPVGRQARIGVVDEPVLEREYVPAGALGETRSQVGPDRLRPLLEPVGGLLDQLPEFLFGLLLLGEGEPEVVVEVALYDDTHGNFQPIRRL